MVVSDLFCNIFKKLTKEQQAFMFQQILDSVDKTKYDTCTIEY